MGSLMSGWNSPKAGRFDRNKSLTKEEIDAYWKIKKKTEEEHLQVISTVDASRTANNQAATSDDLNSPNKSGWWAHSTWAFLNETPVMELPRNRYVSQLDVVAKLKVTPSHSGGVGA